MCPFSILAIFSISCKLSSGESVILLIPKLLKILIVFELNEFNEKLPKNSYFFLYFSSKIIYVKFPSYKFFLKIYLQKKTYMLRLKYQKNIYLYWILKKKVI